MAAGMPTEAHTTETPTPDAQDAAERRAALVERLPRDYPAAARPQQLMPMDDLLRELYTPAASLATWHGWQPDWAAAFGEAQPGVPTTTSTVFQAGSISKPVAAIMAMLLVERGELDLDADINTRLTRWQVPAAPGGDWQPQVTLRHLLSHTAGFTYCWYPGYRRGTPFPDIVQTLNGAAPANTPAVQVETLPGLVFRYAGGHYSALQLLLEEVSGTPFADLAQELIFTPLGLQHTTYDQGVADTRGDAFAFGHDCVGERLEGGVRILPEMAAAGIWATPSELLTIIGDVAAAVAGREAVLLQPQTARLMTSAQVGGYGLGWRVNIGGDPTLFGHGGANIGFLNMLLFNHATGDGLAVMSNAERGRGVCDRIMAAATQVYPGLAAAGQTEHDRGAAVAASHVSASWMVGRWVLESGSVLSLASDAASDEALLASVDGQPTLRLERSGPRSWQCAAHDLALTLATSPSAGGVPRVQVRSTGASVYGVRAAAAD